MEGSTSAPNERVYCITQLAKLSFNHPSVVLTAEVFCINRKRKSPYPLRVDFILHSVWWALSTSNDIIFNLLLISLSKLPSFWASVTKLQHDIMHRWRFSTVNNTWYTITGVHSNQDLIWCVNLEVYMGFCVYRRFWLLWLPVIL